MQGRLSPPVDGRIQAFPASTWKSEFKAAAGIGLDCIEWIYDADRAEHNPLASDSGVREVQQAQKESSVAVRSVCADYFMSHRLLTDAGQADDVAAKHLEWLIGRVALLGAGHIVLPFVDASRLTGPHQVDGLVRLLGAVASFATAKSVELHLETDLVPADLARILDRTQAGTVWANLDTGNSASVGHDPQQVIGAIGARLGSVHVKDRARGGGTVPLGKGDADLSTYFELLSSVKYDRPLILQVARDRSGEEAGWIRRNRDYVAGLMNRDRNQQGLRL